MEAPVLECREPLVEKIGEILLGVQRLREHVMADEESLTVLQETAVIRTCLDELEKLVFERYSRECFLSSVTEGEDDVSRLLVVLNRLFK